MSVACGERKRVLGLRSQRLHETLIMVSDIGPDETGEMIVMDVGKSEWF